MLTTGISPTPTLFNPEPITVKGIKTFHPAFFRIYTDKHGKTIEFIAVAEKKVGTSIGTVFKKVTQLEAGKQWMGKVGNPRGVLRNDPNTIRTRTRRELNLDTIREKLAYDLFQELGRGFFLVPKSRLSLQPIRDEFNKLNCLANAWVEDGITESLRIMSRYMAGYLDFAEVSTVDGTEKISFMKYLEKYHRPPEVILTLENKPVPILGLMGLLAVGRCLADVDLLGGGGFNAGFIWIHNDKREIIGARAVKIDPGYAFCFTHEDLKEPCENIVINTHKKLGSFRHHLEDLKDIQTSTGNHDAFVHWKALTAQQQEEFLGTLLNTARYLQAEKVLDLLFFREKKFFHSEDATMPKELAEEMQRDMATWLKWQLEIYEEPLTEFKQRHPEQLLRIHYIDRWGELSLPLTDETFPIRELFTDFVVVASKHWSAPEEGSIQPRVDKTEDKADREDMDEAEQRVSLDTLFDPQGPDAKAPRRILVLGRAGIGKSTLCQKIAHDWASGRLWQSFQVVYRLSLRQLNDLVTRPEMASCKNDPELFLARAVATLILNDQDAVKPLLVRLKAGIKILAILDGYDEASPALSQQLAPLFNLPSLYILVTSRPGVTEPLHGSLDRVVENVGFADHHIEIYVEQFFKRIDLSSETKAFRLLEMLRPDDAFIPIAHIPLQLQMVCSLWEREADRGHFSINVIDLYDKMIDQMLLWPYRRKNLAPKLDPQEKGRLLSLLGKIGDAGLSTDQLMIPQIILSEMLQATGLTVQDLLDTGLLRAPEDDKAPCYSFLHLSFQEYLIAYWVSCRPFAEQTHFVLLNRGKPSYEMVFVFLARITYQMSEGKEKIKAILNALCQNLEPLIKTGRKRDLLLKCINECPGFEESTPVINAFFATHFPDYSKRWLRVLYESLAELRALQAMKWVFAQFPQTFRSSSIYWGHAMHIAARKGWLEILKWMYEKDPFVIAREDQYLWRTPLHLAVEWGQLEVVKWLCQQNRSHSPIAKEDKNGQTPLHLAAARGTLEVVKLLYEKDPSLIEKGDKNGRTPLHLAVERGQLEVVKWLYQQNPAFTAREDKNGQTLLHLTVERGQLEIVKWLCEKNPSLIAKKDKFGRTPLHLAAACGTLEVVKWLCEQNPSLIEKEDKEGQTPLHLAAAWGELEVVKWLYQRNPSLIAKEDKDGQTPLHKAAAAWSGLKVVKWFYQQNPSLIEKEDKEGQTLIHWAAEMGELEVVKWLHQQNPSLIAKEDKFGQTPLHKAAEMGELEVVKWLHQQNPSLIAKEDKFGQTPLHKAVAYGKFEVVKWLYQRRPSLIAKEDKNGCTPLHLAAACGKFEVIKWLCEQNPSLIAREDKNGLTPLHQAAGGGSLEVVKWLYQQNPALIEKEDKNGQTPLELATQMKQDTIIEWSRENNLEKKKNCAIQ